MYELIQGSNRLAGALDRVASDPHRLDLLAQILFYERDQLDQDIKALSDRLDQDKNKEV